MSESGLPKIESVIAALNSQHIHGHPLASERGQLNEMLSILGEYDDYVMAIGMAPNGYLGILLGYAMAKAEGL